MDHDPFLPKVEPSANPRHPYLWLFVWYGFAAVMLPLVIITQAQYRTIGLCFIAWCGGIAFTLMLQERTKRRLRNRH